MRAVTILAWCDVCEHTPADRAYTIGITDGEGVPTLRLLDLCADHAAALIDPLAPIVDAAAPYHRSAAPAPASPPSATALAPCPVCARGVHRAAMVTHIWSAHIPTTRPPSPTSCPDCDASYPSAQGLGAHRRGAHGWDALAHALTLVPGAGNGAATRTRTRTRTAS